MQTDLSVWGMYQHADIVVKMVMIGLILASVGSFPGRRQRNFRVFPR